MKKLWSFLSEHFPFTVIGLVLFNMSLSWIGQSGNGRWIGQVFSSFVFCLLVFTIWKEYKTYKIKKS